MSDDRKQISQAPNIIFGYNVSLPYKGIFLYLLKHSTPWKKLNGRDSLNVKFLCSGSKLRLYAQVLCAGKKCLGSVFMLNIQAQC